MVMRVPGDTAGNSDTKFFLAAEDALRLREEAAELLDSAVGVEWYEEHGSAVDLAALTLCRLRRARAGEKGSPGHGDTAVRDALYGARPESLIWLASRAISYMDETGFPEAVEPWFATNPPGKR
jgi:hypothetical protein